MSRRYGYRSRGGFGIVGLVIFLFLVYLMFRAVGVVYSFLWGFIPVMLILALIFNRDVITAHMDKIANQFRKGLFQGLGFTALNALGLPFVSAYLLWKSIVTREQGKKNRKAAKDLREEYIDFEDATEDSMDDDILDLPPLQKSYRENSR